MFTPTPSLDGSGCPRIPGNPLAWRIALVCLLAWTLQTGRPLLAVESVLNFISSSSPAEPSPRSSTRLGEDHESLPGVERRMAARWQTEPVQPVSDTDSKTLPAPTNGQLPESLVSPTDRPRNVAHMNINIALPPGNYPKNVAAERIARPPGDEDRRLIGQWARTAQHWSATNLRYEPLYFEDVNLERYGYTRCQALQPLISAARFFATIPALPYKMVLQHPDHPRYALGHYRSGSSAPWYRQRLPLQARAGLAEAGIIVGLIFLIP